MNGSFTQPIQGGVVMSEVDAETQTEDQQTNKQTRLLFDSLRSVAVGCELAYLGNEWGP